MGSQICADICSANMASKLCLKALFVVLVFQQVKSQVEIPCDFKDNCEISPSSIAQITCEHFGSSPKCTCSEGSACVNIEVALSALVYSTFDFEQCSTFCKDDSTCAFWKYTDLTSENAKKCFLMAENECLTKEDGRECPKDNDHSNTPECISDKTASEDFTCADGTDTGGQTCPGPIKAMDDQDEKLYVQKWECYYPDPDADTWMVNMYDSAATMPVGGYCDLVIDDGGSCKDNKPFRFTCQLDGQSQKAAWTKDVGISDADTTDVIEDGKLKDVACTAADLKFTDLATQEGRKIVCSKGGIEEDGNNSGQYLIPAENYCHMICDDYDILSFYTDWNTDGTRAADEKRGWFYKVTGSGNPISFADADFLNCWGK